MIIKCPAGKGDMEHTQCLACSRNGRECGYSYTLLMALYCDTESEKRRNEIHVTDITGCLRRAWYSKVVPMPEPPNAMLARSIGTLMHAGLEINDDVVTCELPVVLDGVMGKVDAYFPQEKKVLDIKTTRWLYPDKIPYGSHALQVNIYAYMLRKSGKPVEELEIQYIDMSGPTKCRSCKVPVIMIGGEFKCPECGKFFPNGHLGAVTKKVEMMPETEIELMFNLRREALSNALQMEMPPEKEPSWLCNYCMARSICVPEGVADE